MLFRSLITVSETSREHILEFLGSVEAPVEVIRNGVSEIFTQGSPAPESDAPFMLVVAPHKPHKNLVLLARILQHLPELDGWRLIAVGPDVEDRRAIVKASGVAGLADRIDVPGLCSDEELRDLYRAAAVVVVPSLLEGFGLPALEARACGTRVLAPDLPWARDLLDAGVELVSGWDPRNWARIIQSDWVRMGSEGWEVPRWRDASEATLAVLERVATRAALA